MRELSSKQRSLVGKQFPTKLDHLNKDFIFDSKHAILHSVTDITKGIKQSKKGRNNKQRKIEISLDVINRQASQYEKTEMYNIWQKLYANDMDFRKFERNMKRSSFAKKTYDLYKAS